MLLPAQFQQMHVNSVFQRGCAVFVQQDKGIVDDGKVGHMDIHSQCAGMLRHALCRQGEPSPFAGRIFRCNDANLHMLFMFYEFIHCFLLTKISLFYYVFS